MTVEERLQARGWTLPPHFSPPARFVPAVEIGGLAYLSGVIAVDGGEPTHQGKLGSDLNLAEGYTAARLTALAALAAAKHALGSLERVLRVVRLTGYVACQPDFYDSYKVIDGASEVLNVAFGAAGEHARTSMGVVSLSLNAAVELDLVLAVRP